MPARVSYVHELPVYPPVMFYACPPDSHDLTIASGSTRSNIAHFDSVLSCSELVPSIVLCDHVVCLAPGRACLTLTFLASCLSVFEHVLRTTCYDFYVFASHVHRCYYCVSVAIFARKLCLLVRASSAELRSSFPPQ